MIHWCTEVKAVSNKMERFTQRARRVLSLAQEEAEKLQHSEEYGPHGTWERHLMAEVFDRRVITQDFVVTPTWRMQIFDSLFGFGAILRADLVQDQP